MFQIEENKISYQDDKNHTLGYVEFVYLDKQTVDIIHTFVDLNQRGKGIGKKIIEYALAYFQKQNIKINCSCSYAEKIIKDMNLMI